MNDKPMSPKNRAARFELLGCHSDVVEAIHYAMLDAYEDAARLVADKRWDRPEHAIRKRAEDMLG